jgi:hypothetical protein
MEEQTIEPPIPLTAPDGRLFGYACPRCRYIRGGGISGGTFEDRVGYSLEQASACCLCRDCSAVVKHSHIRCDMCEAQSRADFAARMEAERPEREAREKRVADALDRAKDRNAALTLQQLMSDISEEYYCAGWLHGLEFDLWAMLQGSSLRFGLGEVSKDEVSQLRALSEQSGGWWRWDAKDGEIFVTTDEWQKYLDEKKAASADSSVTQ